MIVRHSVVVHLLWSLCCCLFPPDFEKETRIRSSRRRRKRFADSNESDSSLGPAVVRGLKIWAWETEMGREVGNSVLGVGDLTGLQHQAEMVSLWGLSSFDARLKGQRWAPFQRFGDGLALTDREELFCSFSSRCN